MEAIRNFHWAQNQIEKVTELSKQDREKAACERRLEQMEINREKQHLKNISKFR